jgi:hypothetical protein
VPSAPPSSSDPPRPPRPASRGLSIRWKLFLCIGGLVAVVTIAFGTAAYRAMRDSALTAATLRLDGIASQWARLFEAGVVRQRAGFRAAA